MTRIYLTDGIEVVELDTEDIELASSFSIADIKDIAARKDSINSLVFKGTKINNEAFGNMFHANKTTDTTLSNNLFYNYNPLKKVTCLVYENSTLIFKGTLRVNELNVTKSGDGYYNTIITGSAIDLKFTVQNKLLSDLDFTDLKHRYNSDVISNSWNIGTERFSDITNSFYQQYFEKGSGYIYPFADYGVTFLDTTGGSDNINLNPNKIHALNFRPAIYVKEYFNKIFAQTELDGYTYEVKGDVDFLNKFNSAFIPNADEKLVYKFTGFNHVFEKNISEDQTGSFYSGDNKSGVKGLSLQVFPTLPPNTISSLISRSGTSNTFLKVDRNFISDTGVTAHFVEIRNPYNKVMTFKLRLEEGLSDLNAYAVIGENSITVPPFGVLNNIDINLNIGERLYKENYQIVLNVFFSFPDEIIEWPPPFGPRRVRYTVSTASISFPKDSSTLFKVEVQINNGTISDIISPAAPENIKQYDFLKNIMTLFNLYLYAEKDNPKHLIFQKYDDYWFYALPQNVKNHAINWTRKIDLTGGYKIKSNLSLPKSYSFNYKDDNDRLNKDYKNKFGKTYGSFNFNDSFGITDEKKVTISFSPTPMSTVTGTGRQFPMYYLVESGNKKPTKTNIRILYYNGLMDSADFTIAKDKFTTAWTTEDLKSFTQYPNCSTYYYVNGKPVEDLNFGRPNELYFTAPSSFFNINTVFQNYYINQTTELTNPNLQIFECNVLLNEVDIANLDLRTPVFIDNGEAGHSYYKVLSVDYESSKKPSKVTLQKIILGTDR